MMMMKRIFVAAVCLWAKTSQVSAECEAVDTYLNVPSEIVGDMTIDVDVDEIACPLAREQIVISGGVLTLSGSDTVSFANVVFYVTEGAGLVFDFPRTKFVPVDGYDAGEDENTEVWFVEAGATLVFTGKVVVAGVTTTRVAINEGSMEFQGNAVFRGNNGAVFARNNGKLRFRGNLTMINNEVLAVSNEGGTVRIAGTSYFEGHGEFPGSMGVFRNIGGGVAIFDDDTIFTGNGAFHLGGAVHNQDSKMKFYGKAYFFDNTAWDGEGGAFYSENGDVRFKGAVQFNGNVAQEDGGAISVEGGKMTFSKSVSILSNRAQWTGGAMWVASGATVEFRKPGKVSIGYNSVVDEGGCLNIDASEDSEIIGYTGVDGDLCGGYSR